MQYITRIDWKRNEGLFEPRAYDRTHYLYFGGGSTIEASSAPEFAGKKELPNPEELFISSLSSCFMLTFLYLAASKGLSIDEYSAEGIGKLAKNSEGKMAMTDVVIKPEVSFSEGVKPEANLLEELFKKAHENCFITSSVKTNVTIEPKTG